MFVTMNRSMRGRAWHAAEGSCDEGQARGDVFFDKPVHGAAAACS
jgi:hypothetical protein